MWFLFGIVHLAEIIGIYDHQAVPLNKNAFVCDFVCVCACVYVCQCELAACGVVLCDGQQVWDGRKRDADCTQFACSVIALVLTGFIVAVFSASVIIPSVCTKALHLLTFSIGSVEVQIFLGIINRNVIPH